MVDKMSTATQKISASNPFVDIEKMFDDYVRPDRHTLPFDLLVGVCGRLDSPGPRDSRWEYILDVGMPLIQKVLNREPIGKGPHFFIFPDRWMVPGEAQAFVSRLSENSDANTFVRVYIITHQPYIVGGCPRESVRIITKVEKK